MGTFVIKRKMFASDDRRERLRQEEIEREERRSRRKKAIIGTLGATALAAGAAYGAKKGLFGAKTQMKTNELLGKVGKKLNNDKIYKSAEKDYYVGLGNQASNTLGNLKGTVETKQTKAGKTKISIKKGTEDQARYNEQQVKDRSDKIVNRAKERDLFGKTINTNAQKNTGEQAKSATPTPAPQKQTKGKKQKPVQQPTTEKRGVFNPGYSADISAED